MANRARGGRLKPIAGTPVPWRLPRAGGEDDNVGALLGEIAAVASRGRG